MLKENKILNGSLKPPQGFETHFLPKTWAVNQVSRFWLKWKIWRIFFFYAFHIHTGLLDGLFFNCAKSSFHSDFFLFEKNTFFWKRRGKISSFFNYPHLLHLLPPPQICLPQRKKAAAFLRRCAPPPPSLIRPGLHFYAWNTEVDWKHSVAIQTLKKRDPLSFIRYEDLQ